MKSGSIEGEPKELPTNYKLRGGFIVGPNVDLSDADLSGVDLTGADLYGALFPGEDKLINLLIN